MTYSTELREDNTSRWRKMESSDLRDQESLLVLLDRAKTRSNNNRNWRYRIVSDGTGMVMCEQNQDRSWPPFPP